MLLSLPATDLSSGLAALWDSGWFRPSQPSTFRASHGECPLLFCTLLPSYWEEDQWDNGHIGRFRGEPKKAPWPLDNTDKQIFLHVISKNSIRLSKCSSKGEKCFCFYSLLSDRPASLMMLYIRTVQCLHIFFWTLQYLLFTQLPKNHSTLAAGSRMLIHVLKQQFHLPCHDPLELSRTPVYWFSRLILHLLEKAWVYICTCRFQATSWALDRKSAAFSLAFGAPIQGAAATAAAWVSPDTASDKNTPSSSRPCQRYLRLSNQSTFL